MARDPMRIGRIGVDAPCTWSEFTRQEWVHQCPSSGLRVGVSRQTNYSDDDVATYEWRVSLGWRDIVLRGETSDDLDDAFDAAMEHAHAFVPKLWSVVYDLVEAEKARRQNELARLDREAEGADEEAQ